MRLLNTSSFALQDFIGENIPKYAILSHTWGEEEIIFQDLQTGDDSWRQKKSFKKVAGFCSLSKKDGYEWCWIDTCCIDKSSSAELSEAINSMFRWYARSNVCIVYLADVQLDHKEPDKLESFESSRWHKRGWTLQELLAPESVIFYDLEWNLAGTRFSLRDRISEITGIESNILEKRFDIEKSRYTYCVAEKMSWAATRETSRVEDMAYCLLGIFDVNMPLIYGEGDQAFQRLQLQILTETEDLTLLAWPGTHVFNSYKFNPLAPSPVYFDGTSAGHKYQELMACSHRRAWEIISSKFTQRRPERWQHLLAELQPKKRMNELVLNGIIFSKMRSSGGKYSLVLCEMHRPSRRANEVLFLCLPIRVIDITGNCKAMKIGAPEVCMINSQEPPEAYFLERLAIDLKPESEPQVGSAPSALEKMRARESRDIQLKLDSPNNVAIHMLRISGVPTIAVLLRCNSQEIVVMLGWHKCERGSKHTILPWITCTSWRGLFGMRSTILAEHNDDGTWNIGDFKRCQLKDGSHISCKIQRAVAQFSDTSYLEIMPERRVPNLSGVRDTFSLDVSVSSAEGKSEPISLIASMGFIGYDLDAWLGGESLARSRDILLEKD